MNDEILSDIAIEKAANQQFGQSLEVDRVIVRDVLVNPEARATLFLTATNRLYLFVSSDVPLLLADVKKIVGRMGLVAQTYLPPAGSPDYFEFIAQQKFRAIFPGRQIVSQDDLAYYKTLAPYSPALVKISQIKKGEVMGYDLATKEWRTVAEYRYANVRTE